MLATELLKLRFYSPPFLMSTDHSDLDDWHSDAQSRVAYGNPSSEEKKVQEPAHQ